MNQGNFLGLDIGTRQKLYLDRQRFGSVSVDRRTEDGNRQLNQLPTVEVVVIKGFAYAGKPQQLLSPKKGELELWEVIAVSPEQGVFHWRLDGILGAHLQPEEPVAPPAADAPQPVPLEGDFLPVDGQ